MKHLRLNLGLLLVCTLLVATTLLWRQRHWSPPNGNVWLALSTPFFSTITNGQSVRRTISFFATNVGPRTLDFQVRWFECNAGLSPILATNHLIGATVPLLPRAMTSLTWDLPNEPFLDRDLCCCCHIWWWGHMSIPGRIKGTLDRWIDKFVTGWSSPWEEETLVSGQAFTSNVGVVDYFRIVHGLTCRKWLQEVRSASTNRAEGFFRASWPTTEEKIEQEARLAFGVFCATMTGSQQAELGAPPNAAPPHR
jgi:hypothetical protein